MLGNAVRFSFGREHGGVKISCVGFNQVEMRAPAALSHVVTFSLRHSRRVRFARTKVCSGERGKFVSRKSCF